MAEVQNISGITPNIPFTEYVFYDLYRLTFEKSEFGMIKQKLLLFEMAENFGLTGKSIRARRGHREYFTPRVGSVEIPEYVHGTELSETAGAVEREHPLRN